MFIRKYNAVATIDGISLVTRGALDLKSNPTLAAGDVKISKDGGAFTNLTTLPTVAPSGDTSVQIALSAAELSCKRAVIRFRDQTAPKEWEDQIIAIETYSGDRDGLGNLLSQFGMDLEDVASQAFALGAANEAAGNVWDFTPRTLTQTITELEAVLTGLALAIHRGDSLSLALTGLGNITGRQKLWFTLKDNSDTPDSAAQVQITEAGGLLIIAGGPAATSINGAIVVNDATAGNITVLLAAIECAKLPPIISGIYDVQVKDAGNNIVTLAVGAAIVNADVTQATG